FEINTKDVEEYYLTSVIRGFYNYLFRRFILKNSFGFVAVTHELANYVNRHKEIIPLNTIIKPPSAELRPGQKDSDSLPEYDLLDKILFGYIEQSLSPEQLIAQGCDPALVHRVLKMVNTNEYKRYQSAPILRVSPKAFGMGRRMPVVGKYVS
ncbi:MAG TPA: hypothetical protein PLI16_09765, partial [Bacteroidales bacterium]|nr:hypothetical protein [Bacteroidales bacterium]